MRSRHDEEQKLCDRDSLGFMLVPENHEGDHPEPSKGNYLLNADGSGTGTIDTPAQGAIGVVLSDPEGHLVAEISKRIGPAINTVAEYRALIEGLKLARSRGIQRIRVFLDSELVVDQVNGRAKVRKEHIRPLHTEACSLLQEFPNIRISWVPRKWNAGADALATKALRGR
jgi:ribonuclease HI